MNRRERVPWPGALERVAATRGELARAAGVSRRTLHRYRLEGVPLEAADLLAVAVGRHPLELWPELDIARRRARKRAAMRRLRARPGYREAEAARNAAYRSHARSALSAHARAYRARLRATAQGKAAG